jgi:hypothetical protein
MILDDAAVANDLEDRFNALWGHPGSEDIEIT